MLDLLRLRNLLMPQLGGSQDLAVRSVNEADEPQEDEIVPKFSDEIMREYQRLIQNRPKRPEKPGKLKRFGANTAAFLTRGDSAGKDRLIDNMYYGDYNKEMADWESQLENFKSLAGMEGSRNINERLATANLRSEDRALREVRRKEKRDEQLADKETQELEIKKKRAETYQKVGEAREWRIRNPDFRFKADDKGDLFAISPVDPEKKFKVGINTGDMSDLEKAELLHRNEMEEISARGAESRLTKETIPGRHPLAGTSSRSGSESGTSVKARQYSKAREAYNLNPEWQPYIQLMTGNDFKVETPKGGGIGPWAKDAGDPEITRQINQFIYGTDNQNEPVDKKPKTATSKATKRADGKTHVKRKSDGKTGWVTNPDPTIYELIP